ncbi:septum site-determining protein Ssd [Nocardioides donggukensis]|uniref:Septum site determining protein n=1 Tax=Nocardioides donggukensis TaxID=2774019 RepID=A0A927K603_9ACTN|nr:septum site-determining protein Ssd [Nocardioides donggukensis]MBD8870937.1 septum site determining protein [Nocardioides donggukensis]
MRRPLIVTRDHDLLEELLRLAAAAGGEPVVAGDATEALRSWPTATVVLLGVDLVDEVAASSPGRRGGVHLVGWGRVPDHTFRSALAVGAENVAELPRSDAWVLEVLAEAGEGASPTGVSVGVVGGSGGSGATTFACALAATAALEAPACLIDADPWGPGVDRVLGLDRLQGVRWDALQQTSGRLSARALRDSLPRRRGLGVLTWSPGPRGSLQAFAAREALAAGTRGHAWVVLDLPRGGGTVVEDLMTRCRHLVVTVRGTVPGLSSAARFVDRAQRCGPVSVVVRGPGVDPDEVARLVGAPVIATMPDQRGLDEAVDLGLGPVRSRRSVLARAAREALAALAAEARGAAA